MSLYQGQLKAENAKGGIAKNQNVHNSRKTVTRFLTTINTQNKFIYK